MGEGYREGVTFMRANSDPLPNPPPAGEGERRRALPRLYIAVGVLLVALPLLGYGVITWRDDARERAEACFKKPLLEFEFPAREGLNGRRVNSVAFSADGRRALSGGRWEEAVGNYHAEFICWDLEKKRLVRELALPEREGMSGRRVSAAAVSADGRRSLLSGRWRDAAGVWHAELFLWEIRSGKLVRKFALPEREGMIGRTIFSVAVSADGRRALSGGWWTDAGGKEHAELLLWELPDEIGYWLLPPPSETPAGRRNGSGR